MTDSSKITGDIEIAEGTARFSVPEFQSVNDLLLWQSRIRKSLNELIVGKLKPLFIAELNAFSQDDYRSKQRLCAWFNDCLLTAELAAVDRKTGRPATIFASRARESDAGRIYFTRHGQRQTELGARLEFPVEELELVKREFPSSPFRHR